MTIARRSLSLSLVSMLLLLASSSAAASGADPVLNLANKASQSPAIIRGQLDLGRIFAQQALHRLRTAPAAETPESLDQTIAASYRQLGLGTSGVHLKLQAAKSRRGMDPLLEMVAAELDKAMVHIRNARHSAYSMAPERPDVVEAVIQRLEVTISIVEQVIDLI